MSLFGRGGAAAILNFPPYRGQAASMNLCGNLRDLPPYGGQAASINHRKCHNCFFPFHFSSKANLFRIMFECHRRQSFEWKAAFHLNLRVVYRSHQLCSECLQRYSWARAYQLQALYQTARRGALAKFGDKRHHRCPRFSAQH